MENININDVGRALGLTIIKYAESYSDNTLAYCPFCGDKRGKFSYIISKGSNKNIYNCFKCGNHGNMWDLWEKVSLKTYDDTPNKFKDMISDIFEALGGGGQEYSKFKREFSIPEDQKKLVERASDEEVSAVYKAMFSMLPLKNEHRENLINRGLSDRAIDRFCFKSTPSNTKGLCKKLILAGFNLDGVPGFFNDSGEWDIYIPAKGYFCPCYDGEFNYITGMQIRLDKPFSSAKYLWLSSSKKKTGVSSGALSTFLPGKNERIVIVTEGILKAIVIYSLLSHEVSVIGVPGVKAIKGLKSYLERVPKDSIIIEAFDMDKSLPAKLIPLYERLVKEANESNSTLREYAAVNSEFSEVARIAGIREDTDKMIKAVKEEGYRVHPLSWDVDKDNQWIGKYKGLDDWLKDAPIDLIEKLLRYLNNL